MRSVCASKHRTKLALLVFACALLATTRAARAAVYTFRDEQGVSHFTNSPGPGRRPFDVRRSGNRTETAASYDVIIHECSAEYEIDPALVKAVIRAESGFDSGAVSGNGAYGLMQLTLRTAHAHGVADVYDPRENIRAGVRQLRALLDRFSNDPKLALAAYNAGAGTVSRYGGLPPYRETRMYVRKVLRFHKEYRRQAHGPSRGSI
jgi:soluble lytic murein transglycosylase-like protein